MYKKVYPVIVIAQLAAFMLVSPVFGRSSRSTVSDTVRSPAFAYPFRSLYIPRGIMGSMGFGLFNATGTSFKSSNLFEWDGEGGFFYYPWFSAGAIGKIVAGEPSIGKTMVENRYTTYIKFHSTQKFMAEYIGGFLGLYSMDFTADTTAQQRAETKISKLSPELGAEIGMGGCIYSFLGGTFGARVEHVWRRETSLRLSPGLSINLLHIFPSLAQYAKGFFLHIEWQKAYLPEAELPKRDEEDIWAIGSSVGF